MVLFIKDAIGVFCGVNRSEKVDFLIVGQGLAGSVLALQLFQAGKRVVLLGKKENHSSRVAAGLFNPVTGKNLSKTWMANEVFAQLHSFYQEAEHLTKSSFFHPFAIYRPFLSIEEQNEWMGKSVSPEWAPFIKKVFSGSTHWEGVNDTLGGLLLQQTGFVDTNTFLDAVRNFFLQQACYTCDPFDHAVLQVFEEEVVYKSWTAAKIIFCEGTESLSNPYFYWIPIRPLKGETLTVEASLPKDAILNRGVYAVPQAANRYKIGATYEAKDLSPSITENGRAELEDKFSEIFSLPYSLVGQAWGYRPTSPDRRPIMGEHPAQKNVLVFNGLGTKGVSLAPFSGHALTEFLRTGIRSPTYAEMDVSRYNSLYWKAVQKT
jgi:glycine oxidase